MISVGLLGHKGRMGQRVESLLSSEYSARARLQSTPARGESLEPLLSTQVVIDVSSPAAIEKLTHVALASSHRPLPALIVGSTGWTLDQRTALDRYAQIAPVLMSSNFSLGVLALLKILREASPLLRRLGYQPTLTETHHIHKKDAPSGTALSMAQAVRVDGGPEFPIQSIREGEVIGLHELDFHGPADHVVFKHEALDRSLFARGAIEAALWLAAHSPRSAGWVSTDEFLTYATPATGV